MNSNELARAYLRKCTDSLAALDVLLARGAWSNVVRESQEIVELALKGVLRAVGVDPPKWHDVGSLVREQASRLHPLSDEEIAYLAEASRSLRKEREFALYGEIDLVPTEEYDSDDASSASEAARRATDALRRVLADAASHAAEGPT